MPKKPKAEKRTILDTVKTFIKAVPFGRGNWRTVIVESNEHGGRRFIHLRTFNKHRTKLAWYPTRRFFTIPIENARDLSEALRDAAAGWTSEKPDWLVERDSAQRTEAPEE
ncbi:MAG: hypothetical protein JSU63_12525 [Phycisphaerales bacterium]|nr:MAG: hypothetical protein JSU63_12525 [Phycisphaerales bacterium]